MSTCVLLLLILQLPIVCFDCECIGCPKGSEQWNNSLVVNTLCNCCCAYWGTRGMETNLTFNNDFSTAVVAAVLSVEMILALIANGIVLLITITQRKSWKQSSVIFFTSLILAHLVLNVLYLPFTIIALAAGGWIFGSTDEERKGTCYFLQARVAHLQVLRLFWCPRDLTLNILYRRLAYMQG